MNRWTRTLTRSIMANASNIHLDVHHGPVFAVSGIPEQVASRTSTLLQENHDKHHIYFNNMGFHNHIVHHHLSLYALAAPVDVLDKQYLANASYQRQPVALHAEKVRDFKDPNIFKQSLGKEDAYRDYLEFFQTEISENGYQAVLQEFVFKRDERADDMLGRLYAGLLHPIIHLGFGIEFNQPAIVAEALAQAATHKNWMNPLLYEPEQLAAKSTNPKDPVSLLSLLQRARDNNALRTSVRESDRNKMQDGIMGRAMSDFVELAGQYTVTPANLQVQLKDMMATCAIWTFAAQNPHHIPKLDFFHIHCHNCAIFFPRLLQVDWIKDEDKCRLLEMKARTDLAVYIMCGSAELHWNDVVTYKPQHGVETWQDVFERVFAFGDDGHAAKVLRALAACENICGDTAVQGAPGHATIHVKKADWLRMAQMVMDSVEADGPHWLYSSGFESTWKPVPLRAPSKDDARLA